MAEFDTSPAALAANSRALMTRMYGLENSIRPSFMRDRLFAYFSDLGNDVSRHLKRTIDYAVDGAAGAYVYPIIMVKNLIMIDETPLINEGTALEAELLRDRTPRSLVDIPEMLPYVEAIPQAFIQQVDEDVTRGLEPLGKLPGVDNLSSVLAGLLVIGVPIDSIQIRAYTHSEKSSGYAISFPLLGEEKTIYYHRETLFDIRTMPAKEAVAAQLDLAHRILFRHPRLKKQQGILFISGDRARVAPSLEKLPYKGAVADVFSALPAQLRRDAHAFPQNPALYSPLEAVGNKEPFLPGINVWVSIDPEAA